MSILPLDRGYRLSRFGTYNPRELQIKFAGCEITNKLILKLKELELFFGVGNLQNKLLDRKSTRLNSSHVRISYAVFCLKKKSKPRPTSRARNSMAFTSCPPS